MKNNGITRIEGEQGRPLWSVMIPTFNCARYLLETLYSVLRQAPDGNLMQIEVVDDGSNDDPESVVRWLGDGRVRFHQNPINLGAVGNFNACVNRAKGHFVHILHGDDWVEPGFYKEIESLAVRYPGLGIYGARCNMVDESGSLECLNHRVPWMETPSRETRWIDYSNPFYCATMVIRREFYEKTGGFLPDLVHTADWEMWHRAISMSGGVMVNRPLGNYRYFQGNDTSRLMRSGQNALDYLRLAKVFRSRVQGFDTGLMVHRAQKSLEEQIARFSQSGDIEALEANREMLMRVQAFDWSGQGSG